MSETVRPIIPQRFTNWCEATHGHGMLAHPEGQWMRRADYLDAIAAAEREAVARAASAGEVERERALRWAHANPVESSILWGVESTDHYVCRALNTLAIAEAMAALDARPDRRDP